MHETVTGMTSPLASIARLLSQLPISRATPGCAALPLRGLASFIAVRLLLSVAASDYVCKQCAACGALSKAPASVPRVFSTECAAAGWRDRRGGAASQGDGDVHAVLRRGRAEREQGEH